MAFFDILLVESMRVVLSYVSPRPGAGEVHVFPVHANVLSLTEARPIPDTPKTLASTSPSGSVSPKIIKKISQGATPEHRTLQSPDFARCNTTTSHPATLSHRTLRHRAISPCHFRLSHPATQKPRFRHPKSPLWTFASVLALTSTPTHQYLFLI